jgi:DMSO reductase family type II enzyme heme b subunit
MLVRRSEAKSKDLVNPASSAWRKARAEQAVLSPAPIDIQPAEYVIVSWKGRPYGTTTSMQVGALHNGKEVFFRLAWNDDTVDGKIGDINQFVDAAAVMFPLVPEAPLIGMGTTGQPVNTWYWRADWEQPKNVLTEGMGSTQNRDDAALASQARHARGQWRVVIGRSLNMKGAPANTAPLAPGVTTKVAFAIWQGSNQERAGIKAFTPDWLELEIEA